MRNLGIVWLLMFVPVGLVQGQPVAPASRSVPVETSVPKLKDAGKLHESAQPIFYCAQRALDWLKLANMPDGRFVYGFQPALSTRLDGDNFVSQAGATFALARAARYFQDERGTAIARQAALALKLETIIDPDDASARITAAPPAAVNRLAAHGLLVSAIHELSAPGKDLLDDAEQLCNYLRRQQRTDGALVAPGSSGSADLDAASAGWALQGIIRSHKQRPAAWKIDVLTKARPYYQAYWQTNKNIATVYSHTPAYAEAYRITKDAAFAEVVFAMNDWLLTLQYRETFETDRKHWTGGFKRVLQGKPETSAPDVWSALAVESLADACRVARQANDLPRLQRYERALLLGSHFLMTLQYTPASTQHFVERFRPSILGAFHASHQDGAIRIDYTQHALCAMVQYLDAVIE